LNIIGLVQGIGYRYAVQKKAQKLGFTGYIRNMADGSVEVMAEGDEKALKSFIQWCYNGVGSASVQKIIKSWSEGTGEFSDFVIRF